mgnify:CR=1 FL=1
MSEQCHRPICQGTGIVNVFIKLGMDVRLDGFTGTLRTLTLNAKVTLVPNDTGSSENAPDFRLQAAGHDIGAAWKKTSEAGREYRSVTLDDPSFPAPVYARLIEGEDGIAADIIKLISDFDEKHPDQTERTVIWIKRLGSLYPFSRSSNLLKVLDGKTRQLPVILLYPGTRPDKTALSFMGVQTPDRDYRPRIYS